MNFNWRFRLPALILIIFLAFSASISAKVYKWVDENGKTHYSDKPFDEKAQELSINDNITAEDAAAAKKRAQQLVKMQQRQIDIHLEEQQSRQQQQQEQEKKERKLNVACAQVKDQLAILQMQRPVYDVNEKGEREFLDDNQRKIEIAKLSEIIAEHCN